MKKASGKLNRKLIAGFAIINGAIIVLTDAISTGVTAEVNTTSVNIGVGVIGTVCTLSTTSHEHTDSIIPGNYIEGIGGDTTFTVACNNPEGYVVYAVGYGNDEEGVTDLRSNDAPETNRIVTGTAKEGDESNWAFKIHSATAGLIIQDDFSNYSLIPAERTAVIKRETGFSVTNGDTFRVSYSIYVDNSQPAGVYSGKVLYILFDPSSHGSGISTMQDFDCATLASVGETIVARDTRDGNTYRVRKLADNNCWMVDNLRLGGANKITLTPDDSDVSENYTLNQSKSSGFDMSTAEDVYVDSEWGGYYTWMAATAGSGVSSAGQVAPQSICPKGWSLPTGGSGGAFETLVHAYGNDATQLLNVDGPNLVLAGYYNSGSPHNQSSEGNYWSSTAYGRFSSYSMQATSTSVNANYLDGSKNYGYSVRCVAK